MFNIYHFGDSYSDPGNVPDIALSKDGMALMNKSFDIPLVGTDLTLNFRVNHDC